MMGRRNCTVCGGPVKNHPPPGYGPGMCAVLEQEEGAQGIPTAQVQPPQPPTAQNVSTAEVLLKMLEQKSKLTTTLKRPAMPPKKNYRS